MNEPRCWIAVASQDHVEAAVAGGWLEVSHGKAAPIERMHPGDGVAYYAPRAAYPHGARLQAFTAIGRVRDAPIYQSPRDHQPFRRAVEWLRCAPTPVKPLLDDLSFVRNKSHWGAAFRFGWLRVPAADFALIARAMGCAPVMSGPEVPPVHQGDGEQCSPGPAAHPAEPSLPRPAATFRVAATREA